MNPLNVELFLACPLSAELTILLAQVTPYLIDTFISDNGEYLQQVEGPDGQQWLGRFLGASFDLAELDTVVPHVLSLITRLAPNASLTPNDLHVLALSRKTNTSCQTSPS